MGKEVRMNKDFVMNDVIPFKKICPPVICLMQLVLLS